MLLIFSGKCCVQLLSVIVTDCPRTHTVSHGKSQGFLALNPASDEVSHITSFRGQQMQGRKENKERESKILFLR